MENGAPRNFTKVTGKHLCQSLYFNKVASLRLLLAITMVMICTYILTLSSLIIILSTHSVNAMTKRLYLTK